MSVGKTRKPKKANYVNNKEFTAKLVEFVRDKQEDESITLREHENGDYIGQCIMDICTNIGNRGNFSGYTYKDEMILDAIENCVKAAINFNADKSANAFGYFSRVAFNAFVRRLKKEKNFSKRKLQFLSNPRALNEIIEKQFDRGVPGSEHENNIQLFVDQLQNQLVESDQLIDQQEIKKDKPKKEVISPLDRFL